MYLGFFILIEIVRNFFFFFGFFVFSLDYLFKVRLYNGWFYFLVFGYNFI